MKIWIGTSLIICITGAAAIMDFRYRKVWNNYLLGAFIIGLIYVGMSNQFSKLSIIGFILPFLIHFLPFKYRMVSAGDIKIFMLIGLFTGTEFIIECMLVTYLIGGLVSVVTMIHHRIFIERMRRIKNFTLECLLTRSLSEYSFSSPVESTLPFALMIHLAILTQVFII